KSTSRGSRHLDHNVGRMVERSQPQRVAPDAADQRSDFVAISGLADRGTPAAVLGEQYRHHGEADVVQAEAVLRYHPADRVLLGKFAHAMFPPCHTSPLHAKRLRSSSAPA